MRLRNVELASQLKEMKVKLRYFPECKACQKYGRQLHVVEEEDLAYDNKGFVNDDTRI